VTRKYGARAFTDPALKGRELDIAGDAVTMPEADRILSEALGRTINFVEVPIAEVRKNSEDFAIMLEWFGEVGYNVDIPGLVREFGIPPTTLRQWAKSAR
jgi:uncharacterized protein YbjT (DUF2867 family)